MSPRPRAAANNSVILVYVPNNAEIEYNGKKTLANNIVIDFDNGEIIADYPPRIKALKALKNPVTIDDSIKIFCTVKDIDNTEINYDWEIDGESVQGNDMLSIQAFEQSGFYEISCKVTSGSGLTDSTNIIIEVKERISHVPEIVSLKANPGKINLGGSTAIYCKVYEENGDEITYTWVASEGGIISTLVSNSRIILAVSAFSDDLSTLYLMASSLSHCGVCF